VPLGDGAYADAGDAGDAPAAAEPPLAPPSPTPSPPPPPPVRAAEPRAEAPPRAATRAEVPPPQQQQQQATRPAAAPPPPPPAAAATPPTAAAAPPAPSDMPPTASAELLFSAGAAALRGELALHNGEYELLSHLNGAAAGHYGNMADLAAGLGVFASALTAKDASFAPFLGIMDAIDAQVRARALGRVLACVCDAEL
jgi:hypothetical protein